MWMVALNLLHQKLFISALQQVHIQLCFPKKVDNPSIPNSEILRGGIHAAYYARPPWNCCTQLWNATDCRKYSNNIKFNNGTRPHKWVLSYYLTFQIYPWGPWRVWNKNMEALHCLNVLEHVVCTVKVAVERYDISDPQSLLKLE